MKGKKIEHDGVSHWFCVEKSKTERDLARLVSRAMKILREALDKEGVDTADKDILDADWNRGVVWVRGTKVLMRNELNTLSIISAGWTRASVPIASEEYTAKMSEQ